MKNLILVSVLLTSLLLTTGGVSGKEQQDGRGDSNIHCLAEAMYYEARGEGRKGQEAVALVTLNRVKHKRYPNTICSVVYQRGQYGWTRRKHAVTDKGSFARIKALAASFYVNYQAGKIPENLVGIKNAIYFTNGNFKKLRNIGRIGRHNFFR